MRQQRSFIVGQKADIQRALESRPFGQSPRPVYLWLPGRSKDIIIRGGQNLDPALIEEAFFAHPAVALAAAVGRPDTHAGEVPVVFVELRAGQTATEVELLAFACARIPERAAHPKAVHLIEAMPLTAVGKVFKPALRDRLRSET